VSDEQSRGGTAVGSRTSVDEMDLPPKPENLSIQQLQELTQAEEVRVATRPDGSKTLVKIDGVEDLIHTDRLTSPEGVPYSLRFVVGYDTKAAAITLSPAMIDELIDLLETHREAFEEAERR
jgi:hypothetical protein